MPAPVNTTTSRAAAITSASLARSDIRSAPCDAPRHLSEGLEPVGHQDFPDLFGALGELEQLEVHPVDHLGLQQVLEVDQLAPVRLVEQNDGNHRRLVGLAEGEDFEQLVEGAEAAGEDHQ